jgi:hypothetical protein
LFASSNPFRYKSPEGIFIFGENREIELIKLNTNAYAKWTYY